MGRRRPVVGHIYKHSRFFVYAPRRVNPAIHTPLCIRDVLYKAFYALGEAKPYETDLGCAVAVLSFFAPAPTDAGTIAPSTVQRTTHCVS